MLYRGGPVSELCSRLEWTVTGDAGEMSMSATRAASGTRIVRDPQILGGEPVVRGTRISVRTIVVAHRGWGNTERIVREYLQLQPIDVEAALAYYEAHRPEIDRYIRENLED